MPMPMPMPTKLDKATDFVKRAEKKAKRQVTLLCWDKIEPWQQDNHYILRGYRPASNSHRASFASLGHLHNESVNIYTHLFGAVAAILASFPLYDAIHSRSSTASTLDLVVFGCFFAGAAACLGMSAAFHTLNNHSQHVGLFYNKLDHLGIVFLIWGSFIPTIYYGLFEHPQLVRAYWSMITTLAAGCAMLSQLSFFASPVWRPFRAAMFTAMGLSGLFPVVHGLRLHGVNRLQELMGLNWLLLQGVLYILGAVVYAARLPERFRPGVYDIWGNSHQIFHVLVLLAATAHLEGLLKAFDCRHGGGMDHDARASPIPATPDSYS